MSLDVESSEPSGKEGSISLPESDRLPVDPVVEHGQAATAMDPPEAALAELEEYSEPLTPPAADHALSPGATLTLGDQTFEIREAEGGNGYGLHRYQAEQVGRPGPYLVRGATSPDARIRLEKEAELLRSVSNPCLSRLVASGTLDGRTYLVTARDDGPTLAAVLADTSPPPFETILRWMSQVTLALAELHEAGWAHCGVRPAAIRIGRPVVLGDLQFAQRLTGEAATGDVAATETVYHGGYSPPEILAGGKTDARGDLYSVGAILLQAATGSPPPESGVELATIGAGHGIAGLPQLLHRCLGSIEQRFATARELHAALLDLSRRLAPRTCWECAGASSIGLEATRRTNQDAVAWMVGERHSEFGSESALLAVVADGMGGMEGGELAATAAVEAVRKTGAPWFAEADDPTAPDSTLDLNPLLTAWLQSANGAVHETLRQENKKGGCTIVTALARGSRLFIAYVGDCRAYLIRAGEARLLTRDHSYVMSLVAQGMLSLEEVRTHPDRSRVTRSLGERANLPDYYVDTLAAVPSAGANFAAGGAPSLHCEPGDLLVLCSDGLWEPVDEAALVSELAGASGTRDMAHRLTRRALKEGGPDNIAVVVARLIHVSS